MTGALGRLRPQLQLVLDSATICCAAAGTMLALARATFAKILSTIASGQGFALHWRGLMSDATLRGSLAWVMLPGIASAAVALQLPEERQPRECTWDAAADMAAAVHQVSPLHEALQGAGSGDGNTCTSDNIAIAAGKLLQAAALLVQHVPLGSAPTDLPAAAESLALQLSDATYLLNNMDEQAALGRPVDAANSPDGLPAWCDGAAAAMQVCGGREGNSLGWVGGLYGPLDCYDHPKLLAKPPAALLTCLQAIPLVAEVARMGQQAEAAGEAGLQVDMPGQLVTVSGVQSGQGRLPGGNDRLPGDHASGLSQTRLPGTSRQPGGLRDGAVDTAHSSMQAGAHCGGGRCLLAARPESAGTVGERIPDLHDAVAGRCRRAGAALAGRNCTRLGAHAKVRRVAAL